MTVSIVSSPDVQYPEADEYYSPNVRYPEYPYDHIATGSNKVYDMVRQSFVQNGLDAQNFGTAAWNPLRELMAPGSSVFVLCNFVHHRRPHETLQAFWSKCTHGSVLRAVIDYVLLAVGPAGRVTFGNAPLQSCKWEKVLNTSGAATVLDFYTKQGATVQAKDLRLFVAERDILGRTTKTFLRDETREGVEIDLGKDSLLAELYGKSDQVRFRVSDYDPRRIESYHSALSHRYVIHKEILASDVVLSLPKLKTHQKVGITCGLKGFVGIVGHKDCLAHHRFGDAKIGGDEYPDSSRVRYLTSGFHDWVYSRASGKGVQNLLQIVDRSLKRIIARTRGTLAGAWHGNDTAWRMTLDLARIAYYADVHGLMHNTVQRIQLLFIDGILGGEGNGPLAPQPVASNTLVFSRDVAAGDWIACRLMGFDPASLPLLYQSFLPSRYPIHTSVIERCAVNFNGCFVKEDEITPVLSRQFLPPPGWRSHLEKSS